MSETRGWKSWWAKKIVFSVAFTAVISIYARVIVEGGSPMLETRDEVWAPGTTRIFLGLLMISLWYPTEWSLVLIVGHVLIHQWGKHLRHEEEEAYSMNHG